MDIYGKLSYHLLLYFEWWIFHGVKGSKLIWWIRGREEVKVLIELLAMYEGVI